MPLALIYYDHSNRGTYSKWPVHFLSWDRARTRWRRWRKLRGESKLTTEQFWHAQRLRKCWLIYFSQCSKLSWMVNDCWRIRRMEFINYDSDVVLLIFSILSTVSLRGLPMVVEIFSEYLLVWSSIRRIVKVAVACQRLRLRDGVFSELAFVGTNCFNFNFKLKPESLLRHRIHLFAIMMPSTSP